MSFGKKMLSVLNRIVPKKDIVLITSFPPFRDNALALYQFIINERKDLLMKYDFVWAQDNVSSEIVDRYIQNGKYIRKNSLKGFWYFLRAKYVISTHDYFSDVHPGKKQIQVNLWHGNGYKVIPPKDRVYRGDYTIGTSELYRPIISEKLGIKIDNVWITGLPRNDNLFHKSKELIKITNGEKYRKVLLWMPTYRKAKLNHAGIDGNTNVFGLNSFLHNNFNEFDAFLREKEILLLIKPHPMDELSDAEVNSTNNIIFFTDKTLEDLHINLYSLLAETDALISDYSSVVVDYLLTGKPIGVLCGDIDEYKNNRGFVLNPVIDYLPGPIIQTTQELRQFITSIDQVEEAWKKKRMELTDLFHQYQDDHSSERVCKMVFDSFYYKEL